MSISELVRKETEEVKEVTIVAPKPKIYATPEDLPELGWWGKIAAGGITVGAGLLMTVVSLTFINYARSENPALFLIPAVGAALFLARGVDARRDSKAWCDLSNKANNDVNEV